MRQDKKFSLMVIVLFFWAIYLFAQPPDTLWTRTYGGIAREGSFSVQQTCDGGYIMTGPTMSYGAGGWDVYLVKIDSNGVAIWTRTFGGNGEDWSRTVQQTSDSGYIIVGWTSSFGSGGLDIYLIKTDINGNLSWQRTYGGSNWERGYWVEQTVDGGYVISGWTESFGAGDRDIYLIKTDTNGNVIWTRTFGGSNEDFSRSCQQTSDGGYIVGGWTSSFGVYGQAVYLVKTDSDGNAIWSKIIDGPGDDHCNSLIQTKDGGYILAGGTTSFGAGAWDVYLIKTDVTGNMVWSKTFGGYSIERMHHVKQTSDGGYIMVGFTSSFGAGNYDFYVIKTDVNGDSIWTKTYGGRDYDCGESVQETSDGGYIITGQTMSYGAGDGDFYLIKTGKVLFNTDVGVTQILNPTGNIYHGSNIRPRVEVKNFGNSVATFPIVFNINIHNPTGHLKEKVHQVVEEFNYSDTIELTLPAGAIDTVEFASWEAILGEYNTISYTVLTGDENSSNDTAYGSFNVVSRLIHDVGPLQILNPLDTIYAGTIVTPVAVIKNFGLSDESFLVFFMIIGEYVDFRFVSLEAGQIDTIIFDPWFALAGNYNEMVATYLQTDENPNNNIVLEILQVIGEQRNDIGGYSEKMSYNLLKPYPNPTSDNLLIRFSLMQQCHVNMKIYDINGRIVKSLISETKAPGFYSLNTNCASFKSGVYLIKLKTKEFEAIEKFTVTK
jgi:hypothetical protein